MSRLANSLDVSNGQTFDQLQEQAEAALSLMASDGAAHLEQSIAVLKRTLDDHIDREAALHDIKTAAAEIFVTAGMMDRPALSAAGKLILDYASDTASTEQWSPRLLGLFCAALSPLLKTEHENPQTAQQIVSELQVLASRALSGRRFTE